MEEKIKKYPYRFEIVYYSEICEKYYYRPSKIKKRFQTYNAANKWFKNNVQLGKMGTFYKIEKDGFTQLARIEGKKDAYLNFDKREPMDKGMHTF